MLVTLRERTSPAERSLSLAAAVERLADAQDLDAIIRIVRETARHISGADGVTFVLRDGEHCHYIEENAVGPLWKGKRFPLTACISGWCMNHGEMAVISDIYADPRIPHDAYRPTFVKSLVMAPVGSPRAMAAIGSYWSEYRDFSESELTLLSALARSTAAAIATVSMREAVKDREARLNMAIVAGSLGAWEWDFASDEILASAQCRGHLGLAAYAPFSYVQLLASTHADDRDRLMEAMDLARDTMHDLDIEFRAVWPDASEHWLEFRGRVVKDESGDAVRMTGVTLDVTDRVEAKDRIDRLQSEVAHMGRLNDMSRMVSALAHELNQPLTAAKSYMAAAHRLLEGNAAAGKADDAVVKASDQFKRAQAIIDRTRGFVSKAEVHKKAEPVAPLVEEAIALSQLDPRHRGVEVAASMADDLPPIHADKIQVQQVLLNLLRNAYEAMASDGNCERPAVAVSTKVDGRNVAFAVSDNGPGLAPDVAARLFQPFTTTKSSGMGVGLSICRGLIESNGGKMWHEPGDRGAIFSFTLPIAK